ncbi:hypothetical protein [Tychonema sp. BBK16]|nr:hypothetical protein [Tychonema sp. BBK16]MCF6374855.1 hypothetical protein [Tychonema sp. BBK16]
MIAKSSNNLRECYKGEFLIKVAIVGCAYVGVDALSLNLSAYTIYNR